MTSEAEITVTEVAPIKLEDGQTLSDYLREVSEKGKSEYVKERANKIIHECLPSAKKGEMSHTVSRIDAIQADVVEYLESHGITVDDETSRLSKTYTYVVSWDKPEEQPVEQETIAEAEDDDEEDVTIE